MKYLTLLYSVYYLVAISLLVTAFFVEKSALVYMYPLPVLTILGIYLLEEKKNELSFLYILSLVIVIVGGIFLLLGLREYVSEVSILFSFFYIFLMRLMYLKNRKKQKEKILYYRLVLIMLPILYIYDRVMRLISPEIKTDIIYFSVLIILALLYIILSLYYYMRNKSQVNLWMLIMSCNLGLMNLVIMLNELYVAERILTITALFCYCMMLYFSLKFMLEDFENALHNTVD
ncbi:hypothetical protein C8N46_10854 [Kordia periserrulae]|uniref:YhhN-like protein n=1 Tax=Kordia periserrulae TaxID=701523 RepID=A0A2T6BUL1_9FLAO|nr:hypothetical protein [Kordia periserrulae]PTX59744.1 hypothetical protein C8N46_10854 [Kordia periserrulae]